MSLISSSCSSYQFRRGHNINAVTRSSPIDTMRTAGICIVIKDSMVLTPINDAGRSVHAGQISVSAPNAVATLLARLVPRGQLPKRRCHTAKPISSANRKLSVAVKANSDGRTEGRGMDGKRLINTPSSHAKNNPAAVSVIPNGTQKYPDFRNRNVFIFFFLPSPRLRRTGVRFFMEVILSVAVHSSQQKTSRICGTFFRNVV